VLQLQILYNFGKNDEMAAAVDFIYKQKLKSNSINALVADDCCNAAEGCDATL
jgi:hypothetical protein